MFDVEEIYEFASLSLAAMPYRFLFLGVDNPITASIVVSIKFVYKILLDVVIFTPWYIKLTAKFKRISNKVEDLKGKQNFNESQENLKVRASKEITQSQTHSPTPSIAKVETNDELKKITYDQSNKFFYQQFLDCNDILAALVIVVVLRSFEDNAVSDLENKYYNLFLIESSIELVLDFGFTFIAYFIVGK